MITVIPKKRESYSYNFISDRDSGDNVSRITIKLIKIDICSHYYNLTQINTNDPIITIRRSCKSDATKRDCHIIRTKPRKRE